MQPTDRTVAERFTVNGRVLTPGTEVSISGERGRFRFRQAVTRGDGVQWLDFIGGPDNAQMFRSFRPERVRRVHRIARTRENTGGRL